MRDISQEKELKKWNQNLISHLIPSYLVLAKIIIFEGYAGYVFALRPENIYGKTFFRSTKEIKCGTYYRNRPHFDEKWTTIARESYEHPGKVDGNHNLIPTSKKFKIWKRSDISQDDYLGSTMRERIKKQLEKKKLDGRILNQERVSLDLNFEERKKASTERPKIKFYNPVVGYAGFNRMVEAGNLHAKDWQKHRKDAKSLIKRNQSLMLEKNGSRKSSKSSYKSSMSFDKRGGLKKKSYKNYEPVIGYQGHIRRIEADNIYGVSYPKALRDSFVKLSELKRWKKRTSELEKSKTVSNLPKLKKN